MPDLNFFERALRQIEDELRSLISVIEKSISALVDLLWKLSKRIARFVWKLACQLIRLWAYSLVLASVFLTPVLVGSGFHELTFLPFLATKILGWIAVLMVVFLLILMIGLMVFPNSSSNEDRKHTTVWFHLFNIVMLAGVGLASQWHYKFHSPVLKLTQMYMEFVWSQIDNPQRPFHRGSQPQQDRREISTFASSVKNEINLQKTVSPKVSVPTDLVGQMAKDIPDIRECLAHSSQQQVMAALDTQILPLSPGHNIFLMSGSGREPCKLFGARMPMQWIYEKTDNGYIKLLDVGAVDAVNILGSAHMGYKDLQLSSIYQAGTAVYTETYVFDGQNYHGAGDSRTSPIVNRSELSSSQLTKSAVVANQSTVVVLSDELAGSSIGEAHGVRWVQALGNHGALFSADSSSRIEYPNLISTEGTIEFWIRVDSGYGYDNYVFKRTPNSAMIFSTDAQGGDVTWPGAAKLFVSQSGNITFFMATSKYNRPAAQSTEAVGTQFRFGKWHALGISYGSLGQYIMLDGQTVASAPNRTQQLGRAGTHQSPADVPTIGETVSHYWGQHQYEGGFYGTVAWFRISSKQQDWYLARGIGD
jgi:hypothetical protein